MEGPPIKTRIITALFALPLLILIIIYAPYNLFNLIVTIVSGLGLHEFFTMTLPKERFFERTLATISGSLLTAALCWQRHELALIVSVGLFMLFAIVYLFRFRDLSTVTAQLGVTLMGFLYLPLMLSFFARLRALESGVEWVFLVLLLVMVGDSAAYFVGSAIGKAKLYPAISPNKSIEGAIGGLAGSLVAVLIYSYYVFPELGFFAVVIFVAFVGVLSQIGDLFESLLKRSCGVKDSGRMIPGHGGLLDRLDSLLFAFPTAYCLALFIGPQL
jgi:phosphatidate cytidylyltransferase